MSTPASKWQKLLSANSTSTGFTASLFAPTAAASITTTGVIDLVSYAGAVPDNIEFMFFGAGADNTTYSARVYGADLDTGGTTYLVTPLCEIACTLSATVGATGLLLIATDRLVDTMTLATGYNQGAIVDVTSPTGDVPGHILLDHRGFTKLIVDFDMTGATNGNAVYRFVNRPGNV